MFKKILTICALIIISTVAVAKSSNPEDLLNITNYQKNQNKPYQGGTFVYIDLPQENKTKTEFNPIPLLPTGTYIIKTPFGHKTEAAFVPHTTDFVSIIHILNDTDIMMQQTIQFVNTKGKATFSRIFDLPDNVQISLIESKRDNKSIDTISVSQVDQKWILKDNAILSSGIYSYTISYLIKGAIQPHGNGKQIRISLSGSHWNLPTERFSAIILFPTNVSIKSHTLLFGTNNVQIKDGFTSKTDNKNITYHLSHPLPAYADVKIDILLDKFVSTKSFIEKLSQYFNHFLFFLCLGVLIIYAFLTRLYLSHHKEKYIPIKELSYYSYISLRFVMGSVSNYFLEAIICYLKSIKKETKTPKFLLLYPSFISIFAFINIMRKYLLTMGLIIGLTIFQATNIGFTLTMAETISLVIIMIILNIWLYYTGEKKYIKNKMNKLIKILFESDITFGASLSSLKALYLRFYPYTLIMKKETEWTKLMNNHKLNTSSYHFQEEKNETN
ncbi:MAG: DUF2207 domain-containing protein [Alphaproteobacteria bacterium]|nr:DUF2207 domain-containing protein [Alphaproteobacteria bacterium]